MSTRDILTAIIKYTAPSIKDIRFDCSGDTPVIQGCDKDKVMHLVACLDQPIQDFKGIFGASNLDLLKGLLAFSGYKTDDSSISVKLRNDADVETIEFRDARKAGSDFRCMSPDRVPQMKKADLDRIPWPIALTHTTGRFTEFSQLANLFGTVDAKDALFGVKVEKGNLVAMFGNDHATTHRGSLILEEGVKGSFAKMPLWSHSDFIGLLKLAAGQEVIVRFSDAAGVLGVEIKTPIGPFKYYLRSQKRE